MAHTAQTLTVTLINRSDGSVEAHRTGCRDIKRRHAFDHIIDPETFATKHECWAEYNADFLAEGSGAWDIDWKPCTDSLPEGEPCIDTREED